MARVWMAGVWVALLGCGDGKRADSGYPFEVGPDMLPGDNCRACHKADGPYPEAPEWTVAGTVFASAEGGAGVAGVTVRIEDADGQRIELVSNGVGNFYTAQPVVLPYRVELEAGGRTVAMPAPPPSGGCNACHAPVGLGGAPGALFVGDYEPAGACEGDDWVVEGTRYPCAPGRCTESGCVDDEETARASRRRKR